MPRRRADRRYLNSERDRDNDAAGQSDRRRQVACEPEGDDAARERREHRDCGEWDRETHAHRRFYLKLISFSGVLSHRPARTG